MDSHHESKGIRGSNNENVDRSTHRNKRDDEPGKSHRTGRDSQPRTARKFQNQTSTLTRGNANSKQLLDQQSSKF